MILERVNRRIFGYTSLDLPRKSSKLIFACCDMCGKIRTLHKVDYRDFCLLCTRYLQSQRIYSPLTYIESELLWGLYWGENYSIKKISDLLSLNTNTIRRYMIEYMIPRRERENHILMCNDIIEFLEGELLGDGCLLHHNVSSSYQHASKYKEYVIWIRDILNDVGINQVGTIYGEKNKLSNCDGYRYVSKRYRELLKLYLRWYLRDFSYCPSCEIILYDEDTNRRKWVNSRHCPICDKHDLKKKIVPNNLRLTPIMLRQWYIGDGSLIRYKKYNSFNIVLATNGFLKSHTLYLINELQNLGIKCSHRKDNAICISLYSLELFFNYIGECPEKIKEIYGYKWVTDREHKVIHSKISTCDRINSTYRNKDWLLEQYTNKKKSIPNIAREFGVSPDSIWKGLKRFNIERRQNPIGIRKSDYE